MGRAGGPANLVEYLSSPGPPRGTMYQIIHYNFGEKYHGKGSYIAYVFYVWNPKSRGSISRIVMCMFFEIRIIIKERGFISTYFETEKNTGFSEIIAFCG